MLNLRAINLKTLWVLLWVAFFITYILSVPGSGVEFYFKEYMFWMGLGMFILSFPSSLGYFLILAEIVRLSCVCCDYADCPFTADVYLWPGVFVLGYLQCIAISRIFNDKLSITTTLNLNGTANITSTATLPGHFATNTATPVPVSASRMLEASLNR